MGRWEDFEIASRRNDGVASSRLAQAEGVSARSLRRWVRDRHLSRFAPGVHLLDARPGAATRLRAALDALGDPAALALRSALWVHGLAPHPRPLTVIIPERRRAPVLPGVTVRRSRTLLPTDITDVDGWSATTVERTLLDSAITLDDEACLGLVIDAMFKRVTTLDLVQARVTSTPTAWGVGRLRRVTAKLAGLKPDSVFEWLVGDALRRQGLRPTTAPYPVDTPEGMFEVDLAFPPERVAIECDGRHHLNPRQAERDARKSNALALAGWALLRIGYAAFRQDPTAFALQVQRLLDTRRG